MLFQKWFHHIVPFRGLAIMAIRVVEFSSGVYKIRQIFAQESTYSKEIIEFWELG